MPHPSSAPRGPGAPLRAAAAGGLLAAFLSVSFPFAPVMLDDSRDYLERSGRLSLASCFTLAPKGTDPGRTLADYLREESCPFSMDRSLLLPLLLRLLGGPRAFVLFENLACAGAWALLVWTFLSLEPLRAPARWLLAALTAVCGLFFTAPYRNAVSTEDLNVSLWALSLALLVLLLRGRSPGRPVALLLAASCAASGAQLFLRHSNVAGVAAHAAVLGAALWLKAGRESSRGRLAVAYGAAILPLLAAAGFSTTVPRHYLPTLSNQIRFHLGGEYTPWPERDYPALYRHTRPEPSWFFHNYPELALIPPPGARWEKLSHPFTQWEMHNAGTAWSGYVLSRPGKFARLVLAYLREQVGRGRFWAAVALGPLALALAARDPARRLPLAGALAALGAVVAADFFAAVVGDFPGELARHTHAARILFQVALALSAAVALDALLTRWRPLRSPAGNPG